MITNVLFFLFLTVWIAGLLGFVYGWVRISKAHEGKVDKQEIVQLFLMVSFWMLFGVELFVREFSYDKWMILIGSLVISVGIKIYERVKTNGNNSPAK